MNKVGIICALDLELEHFLKEAKDVNKIKHHNRTFYEATLGNTQVVLVKCGIGKVNAGITVCILAEYYDLSLIINCGIAGGVNPKIKTLDTVIASGVAYSDVDMSGDALGLEYGNLQGYPKIFKTKALDESLINSFKNTYSGLILTGDQFVCDLGKINAIANNYYADQLVLACDMESAAIAQVCYDEKIELIVIRSISDLVGSNNQFDYYEFGHSAALKAYEITMKILEKQNK